MSPLEATKGQPEKSLIRHGASCELQKESCHLWKAIGVAALGLRFASHWATAGCCGVRLETRNWMWEVSHMKRAESICDEFNCSQTSWIWMIMINYIYIYTRVHVYVDKTL